MIVLDVKDLEVIPLLGRQQVVTREMATAARLPPSTFSPSSLASPVAWKKLMVPSLPALMKPLRKCSGVSRATGASS